MATISNTPRPGYVYDSTDAVWYPIGTGSHNHSEIPSTIVDAKGDIIAASAADTPARLAVGNNGETLVADSSTSTGLRWQGDYAAGKNKIINGDFAINQRNTFTITNPSGYAMADRWVFSNSVSGTNVCSMQSFTPGTAPVVGYESQYFARFANSGQSSASQDSILLQKIEDVRTFANQTVTVSFWAKCDVTSKKIAVEMVQNFGSGGSPSATVNTYFGQVTLTTSWARYTVTGTVPSISGKTIGTTANTSSLQLFLWNSAGSDYNARTGSIGIQNNTFDMWGVQVEAGSTATSFQTATGTIQGELAAAQRYYQRITSSNPMMIGHNRSTTNCDFAFPLKVTMRTAPSQSYTMGTGYLQTGGTNNNLTALAQQDAATVDIGTARATVASGLTAGYASLLYGDSTIIQLSAEL